MRKKKKNNIQNGQAWAKSILKEKDIFINFKFLKLNPTVLNFYSIENDKVFIINYGVRRWVDD